MMTRLRTWTFPCALLLAMAADVADAKKKADTAPPSPSQKTATVAAGERYDGSHVRRFFMGDTYRDLWATPITVPVLNLRAHAGGLRVTEAKKGNQTKSLRFKNAQGLEFAFRLVDKYKLNTPKGWENTLMAKMARDQVSAQHPAGAIIADGFFTAAKVLHPTPKLVVMPDDPALGKYREEFAGELGWIEPFPNMPEQSSWIAGAGDNPPQRGAGWAGAIAIVGSDSLQVLLDADPHNQVDERAYLRARLTDMFLNDWDRHPGNWKWARLQPGGRWEPVSRDRDKVLVNYGGVAAISGKLVPELVKFSTTYPSMHSLTIHSLDLDRRLLSGLSEGAFDSTAVFLQHQFSDSVIVRALRAMPAEYHYTIPGTAATLRERRDQLRGVASQFYRYLSSYVDIHATDEADRAVVTLIDRQHVDVQIRSGDEPPHYSRRFDARDTREVRLYVHGGDDNVAVLGDARPSLRVRIIGGNGHNRIIDARGEDSDRDAVRIYDAGTVDDVEYGPNKIETENADDEPQFDRRPWIHYPGGTRIMPRDHGLKINPLVRLDAPGDLGLVPGVGISRIRYGFRTSPYTSRIKALGEYSTREGAWRATVGADRRFEATPWHFLATARMSELEVLNFYGYGNDTAGGPEEFFDVDQRQWLFHPTLAYAIGTRTDIAFGPIVQYATTDSVDNYISHAQPYGFGDFGQAGVRLGIYGDTRDHTRSPGRKVLLDVSASYYPAWWDVQKPYGVLNAITATYITMPIPVHPILALKAGGKKLLGDEFPFHDAAYIGGRPSDRAVPRERYAGDTSLYGTVEFRVPVAKFSVLLPFDTGVYVWGDAGRVYMDGESPGGWHTSRGVGAWIGILSPATALSIEGDNDTSGLRARFGLNF